SSTWMSSPIYKFDRVGKFGIEFRTKDNPVPSGYPYPNNFEEYKYDSGMPSTKIIYVHRKPIAVPKFTMTQVGSNFRITLSDESYDPDLELRVDKGLTQKQWRWKYAESSTWTTGNSIPNQPANRNIIVELKVKDYQETWSDPATLYITTM